MFFGVKRARKEEIVAELNCKLDSFPVTYLGIPIHFKKLRKKDLRVVNDKMSKRTNPWQGNFLSEQHPYLHYGLL
jgi:hypothetical protein